MRGAVSHPSPPQRLVPSPRLWPGVLVCVFSPFHLSGSVIQSNNTLDINQEPFPIREPVCAGIDKTGGVHSAGVTLLPEGGGVVIWRGAGSELQG